MNLKVTALLLTLACWLAPVAWAESPDMSDVSLENLLNTDMELKADVGSRSGERPLLDAMAPVDVVTAKQIEQTGLHALTDVLRYYIAGFNSPETSVADGSDHVRAFTLRGMAPDQVLVLVNGKRLHSGALLHVNGVIGRGSSGVDINTIALGAIDRIEVLRDGAAAQYGSDAIAGVINIVLKGSGYGNRISTSAGIHGKGDGARFRASTFLSMPLRYDGFVNATLDADRQQRTSRGGLDRRLAVPRVDTHVGLPQATNYRAVVNAEMPLANDLMPFMTLMVNKRNSRASAFYRPPSINSSPLFPQGFLPQIDAAITDYHASAGIKGEWGNGLAWELTHTYGYNDFGFQVSNSMNFSLAGASPTQFDNGGLRFIQQTTNLDIKKQLGAWDLAAGLEQRLESYRIRAGEPASYNGTATQGFAGFTTTNAVRGSRRNHAFYADIAYHHAAGLSLDGALRSERYSDFGTANTMKLAGSYTLTDGVLFRSGISSGFRAPSLSQIYYSQTSSFVDTATNTLVTQGTFRPSDPLAIALGAKKLQAEKSRHFTLGMVYQPSRLSSLTVDYFLTQVNDRIMLSNDLAGSTLAQAAVLAANNVAKARFFTNSLNTLTQGVDVRLNHELPLAQRNSINVGLWFHYNRNRVSHFIDPLLTQAQLLDQVDRLENGQPKTAWRILGQYRHQPWLLTVNLNRYGAYRQVIGNQAYAFNPKWTTDMDIHYDWNSDIELAIGGNNVFGTVPNRWKGLSGDFYGYNGIKPYSRYSPFGYSGAYYYLRASIGF
ncbi:MAG: TonB-dependent receptor [Mariprofundaceae bacterium]|nr:TonB-dependent receptor [Mariprofundaceae bacterium]